MGTFEEVYNHPANEFVAGFIGEPPMNFLACTPVSDGDGMSLAAIDGSFQVRLPQDLRARIETAKPAKVDLGIRPVHMEVIAATSDDSQIEMAGQVVTYEDLGEEGQLAVTVGATNVLVVTQPRLHLQRGDNVTLRLRPERIHLFDAASQQAL